MDKIVIPNDILLEEIALLVAGGKEVIFRPKGNSMLPFIRGDRDSVKLIRCDSPQTGDIILARYQGSYVLHRVTALGETQLELMGDGNLNRTETVFRKDVLGKVAAIIREDGHAVTPGKARLWRRLKPFRRIILGIYRRLFL